MMKRVLSKMMSLLLTLSMLCSFAPAAMAAGTTYSDTDGHWAEASIDRWSEYEIVQGYGDEFRPDAPITRAQMAKILSNTLGLTETTENPFTDVTSDDWFFPFVLRCYQAGVMKGNNGQALPNAKINRQEAMVMLARALEIADGDISVLDKYQDLDQLGTWAAPQMAALVDSGIVAGVSANKLGPRNQMTRAALLVVLDRAVSQYINVPGTYTMANDGLVLVAADNVTLTGSTSADVLITPAADNGDVAFKDAEVAGHVTVQADQATIHSEQSKLPVLDMVGTDSKLEEVHEKPTPSHGGHSSKKALESVQLLCADQNVSGKPVKVGDQLTVQVLPESADYDVEWTVAGTVRSTENTYTVLGADGGLPVKATVTGTGRYRGTVTAETAAVVVPVPVDPEAPEAEKSPVVIDKNATFKDDKGNKVDLPVNAEVTVEISKSADPAPEGTQSQLGNAALPEGVVLPEGKAVAMEVTGMDVDLTLTVEAEGETTETAIHPVGNTTVTLSKEQLGLSADEDLSLHTFVAKHTNKAGKEESVVGEVVVVDGVQQVRFKLNGLSRIWLGNIRPSTVSFDTKGGSPVASQKVKFGHCLPVTLDSPTKSGWLFAGWNYDLASTPILYDLTIEANWVQGSPAAESQMILTWTGVESAPAGIEQLGKPGEITLKVSKDAAIPAGVGCTLTVSAPQNAAQVAVGMTAESAMTATPQALPNELTKLEAAVTDAQGSIHPSNKIIYFRWLDADGNLLDLQSARLIVRIAGSSLPGNYDVDTREEVVNIDRGIGRVQAYLTNGTLQDGTTALPDYAAAINGHLSGNSADKLHLDLYQEFFDGFFIQDEHVDASNYTDFRIEVIPFAGETLGDLAVETSYYDPVAGNNASASVTQDKQPNKTVITGRIPDNTDWLTVTLSDGSKSMDIELGGLDRERRLDNQHLEVATWQEVVERLNSADTLHRYRIVCNDTAPVTLEGNLNIPANYSVTYKGTITIGNGGVLTVMGNDQDGAHLRCPQVIVENGGVLATNSQSTSQNTYYHTSVNSKVVVNDGGKILVPDTGFFGIDNWNLEPGETALLVNEGGMVELNDGRFDVDGVNADDEAYPCVIYGTITSTLNRAEIRCGMNLMSTGKLNIHDYSSWESFFIDGGLTTEAGSVVEISSATLEATGASELNGTVTISGPSGEGSLVLENTGYSVTNNGTITANQNAVLKSTGTVLVNTGTIQGDGSLVQGEKWDANSYENGLEYVESNTGKPDDYSRYQFVTDPALTANVIYFIGRLDNQGTCTLTQMP